MSFYKWRRRDFVEVYAEELLEEDEMAYGQGDDLRYGTIPVRDMEILQIEDELVLQYQLPYGASCTSTERTSVCVRWQKNGKPLIDITQFISSSEPILVKKRS